MIRRTALAALVLAALAAGCSSATPPTTDVAVTLAEWSVTPSVTRVPAGTVAFTVKNAGTQEHEMLVVRSDAPAGSLPVTNGKIDEAALDSLGEVAETAVGASGTLKLAEMPKGRYILLCNIPGHYQSGMHAEFVVE